MYFYFHHCEVFCIFSEFYCFSSILMIVHVTVTFQEIIQMKLENSQLKDFENKLEGQITSQQSAKFTLQSQHKILEEEHKQVHFTFYCVCIPFYAHFILFISFYSISAQMRICFSNFVFYFSKFVFLHFNNCIIRQMKRSEN